MKLSAFKNYESSFELKFGLDADLHILGISDLSELKNEHIVFIKNAKFLTQFFASTIESKVGCLIEQKFFETLDKEMLEKLEMKAWFVAVVKDVNLAMSFLSKPFYDEKFSGCNDVVDGRQMGTSSVHPSAWIAQGVFVGENVKIGADVKIHPGVVLMSGVEIGENTEIYPNTTIYRNVTIGNNVRIHANCTIGADGFGYNFGGGVHHKVWHIGGVIIEDNVEIGANSCVDSGTFSPTRIGAGSKLDNLVQVGHNVKLGRGVILCGQVAIGGSTTIGDYTVFGGTAGAANGIVIGKGVQVAGGAGVTNNIEDGEVVGGFPARNIKEWMKGVAYLRKVSLSK